MSANPPKFDLRLPPHDQAAEMALLGGILRDPDVLTSVQGTVAVDAFYFDVHRRIFAAICDLAGAGKPVDLVTLFAVLRGQNEAGGHKLLAELWEAAPTGANAAYHAKIVRDLAVLRGLIHAANEIARDAYDRIAEPGELIAAAEQKLFALSSSSTARRDPVAAREFIPAALREIDDRIAHGGSGPGIRSGFESIDNLLGGFRAGQLTVVAARPSVGKTAIALNVAANVAARGEAVLIFSLEMPTAELASRFLAMGSGVPLHRITRGARLDDDEVANLTAAASGLTGCPVYVDDTEAPTAPAMISATRRAVRRWGVSLVVIDYLQLIAPENPRAGVVEQVTLLSRRMKQLARSCEVPVICLSQLNREVEKRPDGRPKLSDLRDSGSIEQDADNVILLHRQPGQLESEPVWQIDLDVAKQRNGPIGGLTLNYRRALTRFENPKIGF